MPDAKSIIFHPQNSVAVECLIRLGFLITHQILRHSQTFKQNIHYNDWDHHMYPYTTEEMIPSWMLFCLTIIIPFALIIVSYFVQVDKHEKSKAETVVNMEPEIAKWFYFADFLDAFFYLTLSIFLTTNAVNFLKTSIGRPRPDFFNRCWPSLMKKTRFETLGFRQKLSMNGDLHCETDGMKIMRGAFKSFPSGHAAYTCTAMACLFYYFSGKMAVFNKNGQSKGWKLVALYPFMGKVFLIPDFVE